MRKRGASFKGKHRKDPNSWARVFAMQQPLTDSQLTDLGVAVHMSVERMRLGMGIEMDWHTLAAAVNAALVLCERGVGPEHISVVKEAQEALLRSHERQSKAGKWAFDGQGYSAITKAVELHEEQMANITRDTARAIFIEVRRRVDTGQTFKVGGV